MTVRQVDERARRTPVITGLRLVSDLLNRGYTQSADLVLQTIQRNGTSGILARRLAELDEEAARLRANYGRLDANNPVFRALMADFEDVMKGNRALLDGAAEGVMNSGVQVAGESVYRLALPGLDAATARAVGLAWNRPDPEAVRRLVQYTSRKPWEDRLNRYGDGMAGLVQQIATTGLASGWGPERAAREVRRAVEGLPVAYANTLMRTLQITSYRDAQAAHRVANDHIIVGHIRIAALDDRTCMACVALHGTELRPGQRVDDHHNGRCDSVSIVRNRPRPAVETGEAWFNRQPEERQRAMMGDAMWRAWQDGAVQLRDIPRAYDDEVFGRMVSASSLKGLLGSGARRYYSGPGGTPLTPDQLTLREMRIEDALQRYKGGAETRKAIAEQADELERRFVTAHTELAARHADLQAEYDRLDVERDKLTARASELEAAYNANPTPENMAAFNAAYDAEWEATQRMLDVSRQRREIGIQMDNLRFNHPGEVAQATRDALATGSRYRLSTINVPPARREDFAAARTWLQSVVDGSAVNGIEARASVYNSYGRAWHNNFTVRIYKNNGPATIVHEIGHAIELGNPEMHNRVIEFLRYRAGGETPQFLRDLLPDRDYDPDEVAMPDRFLTPYTGKLYGWTGSWETSNLRSSEIVSMGLQHMYENPVKFAADDPEHFDFILGLIRGEL